MQSRYVSPAFAHNTPGDAHGQQPLRAAGCYARAQYLTVVPAALQEVSIMRKVRHKNVVQFIGACTRQPNLCILVEYMAGGSVYDHMRGKGLFRVTKVAEIALQVSKGALDPLTTLCTCGRLVTYLGNYARLLCTADECCSGRRWIRTVARSGFTQPYANS